MPSVRQSRRPPTRRETAAEARERARRLVRGLHRSHPDAGCTLDHRNPLQLLVATILSAQCTDERVNAVTPGLFRRYPDASAFAAADRLELEAAIRSTGFYRNKARSIQEACRALQERHGGRVPSDLESLTALAGVGRKTANVVRAACFGGQAVIVDTHVRRVAGRLGLTRADDPVRIEHDLMALLPEKEWTFASQALILHGRRVCRARKPRCEACALIADCPAADPGAM